MNLSDQLGAKVGDGRTEASIKLVRMWHHAQAKQLYDLSQKPTLTAGEVRKFELRGLMHLRFVAALDVLFTTTVEQDISAELLQQAKIKMYKARG